MATLSRQDMERLFRLLDEELGRQSVTGEVFVVGGAVMCLAFGARQSTRDVDALFRPATIVRKAAAKVGRNAGVGEWLNDAVKGYLSERGEFDSYLELPHLRVYCARPEYLLAMKCLAMRIGEEFHDLDDVRYLLRSLNIETYEQACETLCQFYPLQQFPQKTLYALEELLAA
jgi:hypothetical protein